MKNIQRSTSPRRMKRRLFRAAACGAIGLTMLFTGRDASAQTAANADAAYNGYLNAFLVQNGNTAYFVNGTTDRTMAYMWGQAYMITGVEDAYDRSPSPAKATLITNLLNTFMANNNGSDWSWDSWNDDVAWACIAFIRGYQITHNTTFLNAATQNWNMAWNRGWDTTVGGGIWENQDKQTKCALSNDPFVISGCLIYDSIGDSGYLNKAQQMYGWVRSNLFNTSTGVVNEGLTSAGALQASDNVYNSGSFLNAANALYKETANSQYFNDAQLAASHVVNTTSVLSNSGGGSWADQFVRALAKFARQNNLWSNYSPWLTNQCTAAWNNRRTDYNITSNIWTSPTPNNTQAYAMGCLSAMVAQMVLQTDPRSGVHVIQNAQTGLVVDNGSTTAQGAGVMQWQWNAGRQQQWIFTQNSDTTWNIASAYSGYTLESPGFQNINGKQLDQWAFVNGSTNEEWWVELQADGTYQIQNVGNSLVFDNDSSSANGTPLIQWSATGVQHERWILK